MNRERVREIAAQKHGEFYAQEPPYINAYTVVQAMESAILQAVREFGESLSLRLQSNLTKRSMDSFNSGIHCAENVIDNALAELEPQP